jgi:hypothetical protein
VLLAAQVAGAMAASEQSRSSPFQGSRRGFVARIVEPIAPNFLALRRVSSNAELAYVSTRSPCSISV